MNSILSLLSEIRLTPTLINSTDILFVVQLHNIHPIIVFHVDISSFANKTF